MSRPDDMSCVQVRERLPLVPGADLLPDEDAQVRTHLRNCAACRKELGGFVRVRRVLRALGAETEGADVGGVSQPEFFARLRTETVFAVRRDAVSHRRRRRASAPRRSFAGLMTAAALFLLGVYLVPLWLPDPEPFADLRPIEAQSPAGVIHDSRFRNVGYGLMGHSRYFPAGLVPLGDYAPDDDAPDDEAHDDGLELVPSRDARVIRRVVGSRQAPRRK